jgi:hypothetical protein
MRAFRVGDAALPRRAPYSDPHLYFLPQAAKFPPVGFGLWMRHFLAAA